MDICTVVIFITIYSDFVVSPMIFKLTFAFVQQLRAAFKRYEEKKPKEQKRKWKKNRSKTNRELEEENLTYYEREFKRRSEEYIGSEQWKKDCLCWLRKMYQQGKDLRVRIRSSA